MTSVRAGKPSRYHVAEPRVNLRRIDQIHTVEIMLTELDNLENLVAEEMQALAFATAALGVLAGAILGWVGAGVLKPWAQATYTVVTLLSAIATLWFGLVWLRKKAARRSLRDRLIGYGLADDAGA